MRSGTERGGVGIVSGLWAPFRFIVGVALVVVRGHVAQIAEDIQALVIAERDDDTPVLSACILLQLHQQIHDTSCLWTSIEEVARLHKNGVFASPSLIGID